ncbi:GTP-binding protein YchF [Nitzschia inconspicua]|uniref:Obg-like ATPase 1 n=1 Tax=Nitzschia inconspicua TaxID=303405 RepID=A0A9K3LLR5_9STRA|nr:GTP-binding protein YchF [Nitzschia inconspicua]
MNLLTSLAMISATLLLKTWGGRQTFAVTAFSSRSSFTRSSQPFHSKRAYSRSTMTMKLQTAIVGLPNVGKSTLFNALTESQGAEMGNYPFCTIESNVGIVTVPDPKLTKLSELNKSEKTVPTTLEFVDVAGLIKGASQGEGLGNKFLASIRQCDAIVHVVRCFENDDVIHVDGTVDPIRDAELINLELAFADLAQVEQRLARIKKDRAADPQEKSALEKVKEVLESDKPARYADLEDDEEAAIKSLGLLTRKPIIYAANVADTDLADGNEMVDKLRELAASEGAKLVIVSAQVEAELVDLEAEDREEFLQSLGVTLETCGLRALIREAYDLLQLQTYYTSGPKETRAWTIRKGWTAPKAAGVIHSDFERGFIRAETISYDDLIECGSEGNAKSKGLLRSEGKDYVVQDSDVILFRFNV